MPTANPAPTMLAVQSTYRDARIVLFGAPYDGTTSYRPVTRFGPPAIRRESYGLETYNPQQDADLEGAPIHDLGILTSPSADLKRLCPSSGKRLQKWWLTARSLLWLGENILSHWGAIEALSQRYPDLHILHFDAHYRFARRLCRAAIVARHRLRRCPRICSGGRPNLSIGDPFRVAGRVFARPGKGMYGSICF